MPAMNSSMSRNDPSVSHEFFGLGERAVGHQRFAVSNTYRDGRVRQVQLPAEPPHATALHLLGVARKVAIHDRYGLRGHPTSSANERHVFHVASLSSRSD